MGVYTSVCLCVCKHFEPQDLHWHHTVRLADNQNSNILVQAHTNTHKSTCMASVGNASSLEGFMVANRG